MEQRNSQWNYRRNRRILHRFNRGQTILSVFRRSFFYFEFWTGTKRNVRRKKYQRRRVQEKNQRISKHF